MTLDEAKAILADALAPDGLDRIAEYLSYRKGQDHATLDGDFGADELEAIAVFMRSTAGFVFPIVARCPICHNEFTDTGAIGRQCPGINCGNAVIESALDTEVAK